MFKAAIVSTFCALLLSQAASAAVIKRGDCRLLHDGTHECDTVTSTSSVATSTTSVVATSTSSPVPAPQPTQTGGAKAYQIHPPGNETLCLSVHIGWQFEVGQSDDVNLRPCDCSDPEIVNTWTMDLSTERTTIKIPNAPGTGWCLDANTNPRNSNHPHLWNCLQDDANSCPLGVQNWFFDQPSGQISISDNKQYCLDRQFGKLDDRPLQIWECDPRKQNPNQKWTLTVA